VPSICRNQATTLFDYIATVRYYGNMDWFVYIAQTKSGYYYTGISNDVEKRIGKHNSGKGAKFARMHSEFTLVYTSEPMTRSDALKKEAEIKKWSRVQKTAFITGQ
jgi:putative endonuclease